MSLAAKRGNRELCMTVMHSSRLLHSFLVRNDKGIFLYFRHIRLFMRRQIKRHNHLKAYITTHIKNTGLYAWWHNNIIKIFKPAHVRLVINIAKVCSLYKQFHNFFACGVYQIAAYACT
jgi:hypothetical protein